ncbi:hypothetical protein [Silvanigrella aquatica]|uniref:Uncharacterized protein n=1 Tax=Silvanigrella aquatica TaxID=1915309 RepID=A0A1L4CYJ8_9BACT|nr:hypothetical protein [Silvanigrella aquatica]APJ03010.1 hypothetical protein AXG55_03400 [Silvanigrella aquatica]
MQKQILIPTFVFFSLFLTSCLTLSNSKSSKNFQNKNFINPSKVSVDWNQLYYENHSPQVRQFINYSKATKIALKDYEIPYTYNGTSGNWNTKYLSSKNKIEFMRKNGVDCTRFLWHLYAEQLNLPYNSKYRNAAILSQSFAQKRSTIELKNFIPIKKMKNGFKPKTGDILAFPGHALAVLDPEKCIAIQSTSWFCKKMSANGTCYEAAKGKEAGVTIYKLMNKGDCENGVWKQLDSPKNKFTAGWRHKAFNTWIEKMPNKVTNNKVITLIGYNISNRFIYFPGNPVPGKTSHAVSQITHLNGEKLDVVHIKVPHKAHTGKLKIYWGNQIKPDIKMTLESNQILTIENERMLSSN